MRRTHQILLTTLLFAASAAPALAQGGPVDARSVRPAVMLLVDTSGSMERIPDDGTNPNCDDCVPSCTGNTVIDRNNKTRWALTVEALTGSIDNYTCRSVDRSTYQSTEYDYGYYLPHIDFSESITTQASDGILDSFASRVKFGLMTFDGVGTTLGGETLVPLTSWSNSAFLAAANGAPGMYSYGDVGVLAFPGCREQYGINAGARGPGNFPGALISVANTENLDDVLAVNAQIEQSLLDVRPFGGTPIAAMLDDLRYYLTNDSHINATGDSLFACRKRMAILITDGAPDAMFRDRRFNCHIDETSGSQSCPDAGGACVCPYRTPEATAQTLVQGNRETALLSDLIVVAYNVHDAQALSTLNAIAAAARTTQGLGARDPDNTDYPYLVQAQGAGELRQKLDELLNASQPGVTSRSVPVSINVGDMASTTGNTKRFDIVAGFQLGRNTSEPWQGLLYRGRTTCEATTPRDQDYSIANGDVFHETLTRQAAANQRTLLTVTPTTYGPSVSGSLLNDSYAPRDTRAVQPGDTNYDGTPLSGMETRNLRRPDRANFTSTDFPPPDATVRAVQGQITNGDLDLPDVRNPNFVDGSRLNALYFGDANRDGSPSTAADRTAVVNYVYGRGRSNALADIYHSQPVVMPPINSREQARFTGVDAKYTSWLRKLTGTETGLHYGDFGRPGVVFVGTNDGVLHAFNLDDWQNAGTTYPAGHEFWAFAPPALFGSMASMLDSHQITFDGSPVVRDVVLQRVPRQEPIFRTILVSALRGAPAYIALDVTYPEDPTFLWQVSFPDVGNTVGNVALTQIQVNWNGTEQIRAVAILPGGEGVACGGGGSARPVAGRTRAEFPRGNTRDVRCWNRRGRALYVVDVATGQLLQEFGAEHFLSPVSGSVAVDSAGTVPSTAAYFFDQDGILWRLSMLSSDPRNWVVEPIYDMFATPATPSGSTPPPAHELGRKPAYAPTLLRDRTGNLVIVAGTGDADSPRDSARQRVVSLREERVAPRGGEIAAEIFVNWQIDLNPNEAVTGPITLFQDVVYFGTFETGSSSSECLLGTSRMWGAHAFDSLDPTATLPQPLPQLTRRNAAASDPLVLSEDYTNSGLVLGVTVRQEPICQSSAVTRVAATGQNVATSAPGGGNYQLTGVMAGGSSGGMTRGGDTGSGAVTQTNPQTIQVQSRSQVTSWASMFE